MLLFTGIANAQIVNIPDANFKAALINIGVDSNNDGEIQVSEALNRNSIQMNDTSTTDFETIVSMEGISSFTNLTTLDITGLINMTTLDLSNLSNLTQVALWDLTALNSINFTGCSSLTYLEFYHVNTLNSLDLSGLSNLVTLKVNFVGTYGTIMNLNSLNIDGCIALKYLTICNTNLAVLDLSTCINLRTLSYEDNYVTNLDLSGLVNLQSVSAGSNTTSNTLRSLNVNGCSSLTYLNVGYNTQLNSIYMKNGINETTFSFNESPNINFICADDSQIADIQTQLNFAGMTSTVVSSYCSFTPGGNYNTITGNIKFDADNNGCDATDLSHSNIRVNVNDGTNTGASFTNNTGNYTFYTQAGNFTLTPSIENPSWFTFSPLSATIPFANNDNNIATQDFCITANGVHNDLEVIIVPITPARPGFEAVYKIVYRNKGNQTLSQQYGINFFYNQNLMQFVSSSVSTSQSGNGSLSWDYTGLQPFESKAILITFLINAPTDNVPVNIGDELTFTTSIMPQAGDENTLDNLFQFNQTVIGSYDPNNIICIEGEVVPPTEIGNYLHYVVNFENTGTAPAENVVVKVVVNTTDFDMDSLQLMNTSHPVDARINGNVVEFIFQSINLDSGGHGNVLLKIKSKNNLQQGDVVEKKADIYFDYNFPIATNDYETTFQLLSNPDVAIDNSISIYPNPAKNNVNIHCNNTIKTIELYDVQGRVLQSQVIDSQSSTMDISSKSKGVYFIKVVTEKGIKVEKLVKN